MTVDLVALEHLLGRGATPVDASGDGCPSAVTLADVDGNTLCLVERSDR